MGYLGGKEDEFQGFSGIAEDLQACLVTNFNSPYCQQLLQSKLDTIYQTAAGTLQGLAAQAGVGPVFAKALAGAKDPAAVLARAKQLAAAVSSDPLDQTAYQLFYSYGRSGMDMLTSLAALNPGIGNAIKMGFQYGEQTFPQIKSWVQRIESNGIDAAGVVDGLEIGARTAVATRAIAASLGGTSIAKSVSVVADYLQLAGGCFSSVAAGAAGGAIGIAGGALTCGLSMIATVFSQIGNKPQASNVSRAVFAPANVDAQSQMIAQDAQRLAALLRYHYNASSYGALLSALRSVEDNNAEGARPFYNYPPEGSTEPYPAYSQREIFLLAYATVGGAYTGPDFTWGWGGPTAVAITSKLASIYPGVIPVRLIVESARKVAAAGASTAAEKGAVRVLEWINFFAAATAADPTAAADAFGQTVLPVRIANARDGGKAFPETRWTRDATGVPESEDWYARVGTYQPIYDAILARDDKALWTIGYLRLLAAFSYLHLQYHRARPVTSSVSVFRSGADLIAETPDVSASGVGGGLWRPLNVRGSANTTPAALGKSILDANAHWSSVESAAKKAAEQDDLTLVEDVAGSSALKLLEEQAGGTSPLVRGEINPAILAALQSGTGLTQITGGTSPQPGGVTPPPAVGGGGGATVAIGAAVAGLLLLKFLK